MPELPEVESVRRSILPVVKGRSIGLVEILTPGVWLNAGLPDTGWIINELHRRGKYLIFELDQSGLQARLVVHLRMTGQLLLQTADLAAEKHTHVRLRLDPDMAARSGEPIWLVFHDTRRFGRLWLLPAENQGLQAELAGTPDPPGTAGPAGPAGLAGLGPEPLDPDFGAASLAGSLARHKRGKLKAVLLDQSVVAGLGNIYADEVLFASRLHPARASGSLAESEIARLAGAIVQVLGRAIECQGTTLRDYVNGWNQQGTFQDCLMVYGRAGQPCRQCGSLIMHDRLAGRTTCWCPVCQPE